MKSAKFIATTLLLVLLATSCRVQQGVNTTTTTTSTGRSVVEVQTSPASQVIKIANTFGAWQTMKAGGTITLNTGKNLSSAMQVRMERNKSIYISVRPLGVMEVGRLVITGDTVVIIDKINKRYICENVKLLTGGVPATVGTLQDIFLGRAFVLGEGTLNTSTAHKMDFVNVDGNAMLRPKEQYQQFEYDFKFDPQNNILTLEVLQANSQQATAICKADYNNVKRTLAGNVAHTVNVSTTMGNGNMGLKMEYSGITWNEEVTIDKKIPNGYRQISGSALLNLFNF